MLYDSFISAAAPGHFVYPEECQEVHGYPGLELVEAVYQGAAPAQCAQDGGGAQKQRRKYPSLGARNRNGCDTK